MKAFRSSRGPRAAAIVEGTRTRCVRPPIRTSYPDLSPGVKTPSSPGDSRPPGEAAIDPVDLVGTWAVTESDPASWAAWTDRCVSASAVVIVADDKIGGDL